MTHEEIVYALLHTEVQRSLIGGLLALAPLAAKLFGGMSKARADARVSEAGLNANQDKLAIDRAVVDNNLTQSKQGSAYQNAYREGVQDFKIERPNGVPSRASTGGFRPSSITGGNALGKQFKEQDLASIMAGTPKLTPPPKAGKFDKFLNIAGGIAGLVGLAGQAKSAFGGGSSIPEINTSANVASDPSAFLKNMPGINETFTPPPAGPIYRRPQFTGRY